VPISRYARRHGVDIDLLTRGASFGYIGSTITSLIYASFTFILFAIEASIMSARCNWRSAFRCGLATSSAPSSLFRWSPMACA
jgi:hypothetical protein